MLIRPQLVQQAHEFSSKDKSLLKLEFLSNVELWLQFL